MKSFLKKAAVLIMAIILYFPLITVKYIFSKPGFLKANGE